MRGRDLFAWRSPGRVKRSIRFAKERIAGYDSVLPLLGEQAGQDIALARQENDDDIRGFDNEAAEIRMRHEAELSRHQTPEMFRPAKLPQGPLLDRAQYEQQAAQRERYLNAYRAEPTTRRALERAHPELAAEFAAILEPIVAQRRADFEAAGQRPPQVISHAPPRTTVTPTPSGRAQREANVVTREDVRRAGAAADLGPVQQLRPSEITGALPYTGPDLTKSIVPEEALEAIESAPYAGPSARRQTEFFTSPLGALTLAFPPLRAGLAAGTAGQIGLGGAGRFAEEELGAPRGTEIAGELIGGFGGPMAEGRLAPYIQRSRQAFTETARNLASGRGYRTLYAGDALADDVLAQIQREGYKTGLAADRETAELFALRRAEMTGETPRVFEVRVKADEVEPQNWYFTPTTPAKVTRVTPVRRAPQGFRRLATEERGSIELPGSQRAKRVTDEGVILEDHIPKTSEIDAAIGRANRRVADLEAKIATGRGKKGVTALRAELQEAQAELATAQAQKEIDTITASGGSVQTQFERIQDELEAVQDDLARMEGLTEDAAARQQAAGSGKRTFTKEEQFERSREGTMASLKRAGETRRAKFAAQLEERDALRARASAMNARYRVYKDFLESAQFKPAEEATSPLVGRRDLFGEERPTFATEAELQGYRPEQGALFERGAPAARVPREQARLPEAAAAPRSPLQRAQEMYDSLPEIPPLREDSYSAALARVEQVTRAQRELEWETINGVDYHRLPEVDDMPLLQDLYDRSGLETRRLDNLELGGSVSEPSSSAARAVTRSRRGPATAEPPSRPPTQPPAPPSGPRDVPTGLPEEGDNLAGAREVIGLKEQQLLRPGKLTQVPVINQIASVFFPSVRAVDRPTLVAYNARQAVMADLKTKWRGLRQPVVEALEDAWRKAKPQYVGPEGNKLAGTIKDFADNPEHYRGVTPELQQAARAYDDVSDRILAEANGRYGTEIPHYPAKEGGFYLPTIATEESRNLARGVEGADATAAGIGKQGVAKTRLYEGAYQRGVRNPTFEAVTDLGDLTAVHDEALASMAGGNTFKLGTGGKTRFEVMQELHPKLATRMTGLRNRLQSLRGTLGRLNERTGQVIDGFLAGDESVTLGELRDALDVKVGANAVGAQGRNFGKTAAQIKAEIAAVRQEIARLRPAWDGANLEPYVLNRKTFRWHTAKQSEAIDGILKTRLDKAGGQALLDIIDEMRLTAFAGDASPLTIQGSLGTFSHPEAVALNVKGLIEEATTHGAIERVIRDEADMVGRYTRATGRQFGELGPEFRQERRGLERIPGMKAVNQRLLSVIEYLRYQAWKIDRNLLMKLGGVTEDVADAEAANHLSKMIPALNPAERGRSVMGASLERLPVISSSFIGGPVGLLKDSLSGIVKLGASTKLSPVARWQALSGREQLAVLRTTTLLGTLSAISVGSAILTGQAPKRAAKIALDPNSPRFFAINFSKDFYIPLGGPMRSFIRAVNPQDVGGVPVPFAGVPQYVRAKATPALGVSVDLLRNKDFLGRKIYTGEFPTNVLKGLWYAAENYMPLTGGAVSEAVRTGEAKITDVGQIDRRVAGGLLGTDIRETSLSQRRKDLAQETFGRDWADLTASEQDQIRGQIEVPSTANIYSQLATYPKYQGFTHDEIKAAKEFTGLVESERERFRREFEVKEGTFRDFAPLIGKRDHVPAKTIALAIALQSDKWQQEHLNPQWLQFVIQNFDELRRAGYFEDPFTGRENVPNYVIDAMNEVEKVGAR